MPRRSLKEIPDALRRHNEEQVRDPHVVLQGQRRRTRVVVLWRQRDDDSDAWVYLERMAPGDFSLESVKNEWGGGAYRIRLFGNWDRGRRQEQYITQVAFWIHHGFSPTKALLARLRAKPGHRMS